MGNFSEALITLPNREEMLQRLVRVSDNAHYRQKFYPILLERAGQEVYAEGIVMMLTLAIADYTARMPVMEPALYMQAPEFIDAIVDDPAAATRAKEFLKETLAS